MIKFVLDGKEVISKSPANEKLLDVLRNEMHASGVKCGCKEGECGACSVIIDNKLANSCLVALGSVEDCNIMTITGYSTTARFAVLEKAYSQFSAVQCGFCIPGMILASECILAKNPQPSEDEIREGISGNLCRCTGYNAIVKAIQLAAKEGGGLW